MNEDDIPETTPDKAYAAALVALLIYLVKAITTGDWTDDGAAALAASVVILPLVVYFKRNRLRKS